MTEVKNSDEKTFWEGPSGLSWITHEQRQDELLGSVAELVISRAQLEQGDRVLDIGCGTGALSLMAAEKVGDTGHVLATDISEPLLTRAAERGSHLSQMSTQLADAEVAEWNGPAFDLAISRFGVMFFGDPVAAFANIAGALKPGGRLVFAAWAPVTDNPYWHVAAKAAQDRLGPTEVVPTDTPGPFGLATMDRALKLLQAAGLTDVRGSVETVDLFLGDGAAAAADTALHVGPARRIINLKEGTDEDVGIIRTALSQAFSVYEKDEGVFIPSSINLLTATRG